MGTRTSIRPRPLDPTRQISIVRDVDELDNSEALQAADEVPQAQQKPKHRDIPTPAVRPVSSYRRDYLPIFEIPNTYIRGRGGTGWQKDDYVEYDLDNEDEDWLAGFNKNQNRLPDDKFEAMLWRLELACAEANERAHTTVDRPPDKMTASQINSIDNLTREAALQLLRQEVGGREPVVQAVYQYWLGKRRKWGKPIMRRLQPPTSASDSNPFNVFRPREKVNRPQTRRRRENNEECLDKLRLIRHNLSQAMHIVGALIHREYTKRDLMYVECAKQQLSLRVRHEGKAAQEAVEAEVLAALTQRLAEHTEAQAKLNARLDAIPNGSALGPADSYSSMRRPTPKRRKGTDTEPRPRPDAVQHLPPPPPDPDLDMLFTQDLDLGSLLQVLDGFQLPDDILPPDDSCRVRIGRGGRVIIDRFDPFTLEPISPSTPEPGPLPSDACPTDLARQYSGAAAGGPGGDSSGAGPTHPGRPPGRPPDPSRAGAAGAMLPGVRAQGPRKQAGGGTPAKRGPGRPPKTTKGGGANGDLGSLSIDF